MKNWPILCLALVLAIALINPKTRLLKVFKEQIRVYKNDKNDKYYWLDFLCFILAPIGISVIISYYLPLSDVIKHAGTIITVFSLIATLPLSFLALFIDKILREKKEKEVAKEAFVSITVDIVYSMLVITIVICSAFLEVSPLCGKVIVGIIGFLVIKISLNILMILKRVFSIWEVQ